MSTIRVQYRQDEDTWVATSPDLGAHWVAVADSLGEAHRLAEEGVRFVLQRDDVQIEHLIPASA